MRDRLDDSAVGEKIFGLPALVFVKWEAGKGAGLSGNDFKTEASDQFPSR